MCCIFPALRFYPRRVFLTVDFPEVCWLLDISVPQSPQDVVLFCVCVVCATVSDCLCVCVCTCVVVVVRSVLK